jgi:hypothetical protein
MDEVLTEKLGEDEIEGGKRMIIAAYWHCYNKMQGAE